MEHDYIAYMSYLGGGAIFTAFTLAVTCLWKKKRCHYSLVIAGAVSVIWHLAIAGHHHFYTLDREFLLILETIRYGAWINALLASLQHTTKQLFPIKFNRAIHGVWLASLAAIIGLISIDHSLIQNSNLLIWNNLILSITNLVAAEQLYRNTRENRLMKLFSIGISALVAYDIYLFSYSLIFDQINLGLWQARGAVNGAAALFMTIGALRLSSQNPQKPSISVSRPVAFYTTSMTASGGFLGLMAIGGYYVQLYGGQWGVVIQVLVLFTALLFISSLFVSQTIRSQLTVWVNKHFFRHKYDYRLEWLGLIRSLSQPAGQKNFQQRAIKVIASVFKSDAGCLWLENNGKLSPCQAYNMPLPEPEMSERAGSPFCEIMLQQEWVFSPHSTDNNLNKANNLLPSWMYEIPGLWLVLPLLTEQHLLGFMILTKPKHDTDLTWEDLDLLKAVGRQVASYLDRQEAAEKLAQSKQFDAFNKLTAFIMHDLKNLIAQQALVVENAAKHKENPAFIEDAINTIDNSVGRMSNLLRKLQQQEPSETRSLNLNKMLIDAAKKCADIKPAPSLRLNEQDINVDADHDYLIMSLANIIKNAQEATSNNGFVDVTLRRENKNAIITIEDNGSGMDKDFIRNRLFKPFETTKSGKGMGIGVFQTREFITSLNGTVDVESTIDEGTTFTITIPISPI